MVINVLYAIYKTHNFIFPLKYKKRLGIPFNRYSYGKCSIGSVYVSRKETVQNPFMEKLVLIMLFNKILCILIGQFQMKC
jgi:hypothetical protein